jgi:hypothetical protein
MTIGAWATSGMGSARLSGVGQGVSTAGRWTGIGHSGGAAGGTAAIGVAVARDRERRRSGSASVLRRAGMVAAGDGAGPVGAVPIPAAA